MGTPTLPTAVGSGPLNPLPRLPPRDVPDSADSGQGEQWGREEPPSSLDRPFGQLRRQTGGQWGVHAPWAGGTGASAPSPFLQPLERAAAGRRGVCWKGPAHAPFASLGPHLTSRARLGSSMAPQEAPWRAQATSPRQGLPVQGLLRSTPYRFSPGWYWGSVDVK